VSDAAEKAAPSAGERASKRGTRGGPKSAAGRARSAKNAFRHGLNLPLLTDPAASAEVVALARKIAASAGAEQSGKPEFIELAYRVAEAQLDLVRVRWARRDLIAAALAEEPDEASPKMAGIQPLEAAEGLAKRSRRCGPMIDDIIAERRRTPEGAEKLALAIIELAPRLSPLDYYERLARSRRKFAMRDFDKERYVDREPTTIFQFCGNELGAERSRPYVPAPAQAQERLGRQHQRADPRRASIDGGQRDRFAGCHGRPAPADSLLFAGRRQASPVPEAAGALHILVVVCKRQLPSGGRPAQGGAHVLATLRPTGKPRCAPNSRTRFR
jgi:hypothetical protein